MPHSTRIKRQSNFITKKALIVQGFFYFRRKYCLKVRLKCVFLSLMLAFGSLPVIGQNGVLGKWKTIDDHTGETKSIVELFDRDGQVYGRILKIFPKPNDDQDPVCDKCHEEDHRYNKKIIGMEIIQDMKKSGNEFSGGNILDPEDGKVYKCRLWIESNDLKVRGYWGPFWRTQTWKRVP